MTNIATSSNPSPPISATEAADEATSSGTLGTPEADLHGRPGPERPGAGAESGQYGAVACVGLGNMGFAMATRLLACGYRVMAWNRSPAPVRAAAQAGACVAATPRAAAEEATHVLVSLADEAALDAVADGPDGFVEGLGAGTIVVAAATVAPGAILRLAERVTARGAHLVDAGVLGNPMHAGTGQLRVYLGGDDAVVEQVLGLARVLGKEVRHLGPLGSGMRLKLVLNLVMGLEMQTLAEAATLAEALGLDRATALDVVGGSGFAAPVMAFKAQRMAAGRYGDPDFRLALMAKDLAVATAEAAMAGVELPMSAAATTSHAAAVAAGLGDLDCAAIATGLAGAPEPRGGDR